MNPDLSPIISLKRRIEYKKIKQMQIKITVKQFGKKRSFVDQKAINIVKLPPTPNLQQLIVAVVRQQVQAFNQKLEEKSVIPFLLKKDIDQKSSTGKVGFSNVYNDQNADEQTAIDNALLAFQDGIYCIFIDDEQIEKLTTLINLREDSVLTFVRLTFLAGSYW